ncbi:MAG: DNA-binding response OmpR family regulator [Rhodothermales bacterium]|jgi:DNA-binding response OmpR family regulator
MNVLIADDQDEYLQYCANTLEGAGFEPLLASCGEEALALYKTHNPLIVCLDIAMPGISGVEICRQIHSRDHLPFVVFITGATGEANRVAGFQVGADDYLEKPFSLTELVARVNADARRVGQNTIQKPFGFGPGTIDPIKRQAVINSLVHPLSPREVSLLTYFFSHPNEALSRESLYTVCWPGSSSYIGRTVDQHLLKLRKKLGKQVIQNVYGVGYVYKPTRASSLSGSGALSDSVEQGNS